MHGRDARVTNEGRDKADLSGFLSIARYKNSISPLVRVVEHPRSVNNRASVPDHVFTGSEHAALRAVDAAGVNDTIAVPDALLSVRKSLSVRIAVGAFHLRLKRDNGARWPARPQAAEVRSADNDHVTLNKRPDAHGCPLAVPMVFLTEIAP